MFMLTSHLSPLTSHLSLLTSPRYLPASIIDGVWRSPVARLLWEQEVPGSNPGAPMVSIIS